MDKTLSVFLCEISKVIKLGRELICYFQELISYALIYYMFYIIYDTKKKPTYTSFKRKTKAFT